MILFDVMNDMLIFNSLMTNIDILLLSLPLSKHLDISCLLSSRCVLFHLWICFFFLSYCVSFFHPMYESTRQLDWPLKLPCQLCLSNVSNKYHSLGSVETYNIKEPSFVVYYQSHTYLYFRHHSSHRCSTQQRINLRCMVELMESPLRAQCGLLDGR